jgi:adenylate kinase
MQTDAKPVFFIMGPQGSGKGTQAKLLAEKLSLFHWDMGRILREEHDFRLSDGTTVGEIIDRGVYLTDEQLVEILKKRLDAIPSGQGIIFDGVPRRIDQAQFLLDHLRSLGFTDFTTLYIEVSRDESVKRLMLRAEKEQRVDDTPEGIALRLKQFDELVGPLVEYLKTRTRVLTVDGNPPIPEVTRSIDETLGMAR